jgi:hypothetical protein
MIERTDATEGTQSPATDEERETVLDDRLLHMTREEAKAYLDEYIEQRGLASTNKIIRQNGTA